MQTDREQRIRMANLLLELSPDILRPSPVFRKILKGYVKRGELASKVPQPFKDAVYELESYDLNDLSTKEVRRIAGSGYLSLMDMLHGVSDDDNEIQESNEEQSQSWLRRSFMVPLAFIGLFLFLGGILGIVLMAVVGQSVLTESFFKTDEGQALLGTVGIMAAVGSLLVLFRSTMGCVGRMIRLALMVLFTVGVGLTGTQVFMIDPEAVEAAAQNENSEILMVSVFLLSIFASVFLWIRRMVMNIVWLGVFLGLVIVILIMAHQSGMIDLGSLVNGNEAGMIRGIINPLT